MRYLSLISAFISALFAISAPVSAGESGRPEDPCLSCHEQKTPVIVANWRSSGHGARDISCAVCHGSDVEASHKRTAVVDAARCGGCHKAALGGHLASRHAVGLKSGGGCTRNLDKTPERDRTCIRCHRPGSAEPIVSSECAMFLAQTPEMQRQGCGACHIVEERCDTCHTRHGTDLETARNPEVCGSCHMGPDHPQMEMWQSSMHGVLYRAGRKTEAPSCVTCHMSKGFHNVSRGVASGHQEMSAESKATEREYMVGICAGCHTRAMSIRSLSDADRVEEQGRLLLKEAADIISDLQKEGLLLPEHRLRPPHPLFGDRFVLGDHMLYENLSSVESLFFRMKQFYYPTSFKGVFHQNPDYAHWYGNAPLKLALSEVRSEAALLRRIKSYGIRLRQLSPASGQKDRLGEIRKRLIDLEEQKVRGAISEDEYRALKEKFLDEEGL